jgi:hypothetical protein
MMEEEASYDPYIERENVQRTRGCARRGCTTTRIRTTGFGGKAAAKDTASRSNVGGSERNEASTSGSSSCELGIPLSFGGLGVERSLWPPSVQANTSEEIDAEELEAVVRLSQAGIGSREEWERANRELLASFETKYVTRGR